jgi:hypothetical protein
MMLSHIRTASTSLPASDCAYCLKSERFSTATYLLLPVPGCVSAAAASTQLHVLFNTKKLLAIIIAFWGAGSMALMLWLDW